MFKKRKIYLDYAGAAPIDKKVISLMSRLERDFFANPGAIHQSGLEARKIIDRARTEIAKSLNAHNDEIIYTGSGTESDALAVLGTIKDYELRNKREGLKYIIPHIITSKIEHPAILENCQQLEIEGRAQVTYLAVDKNGLVDLTELKESLTENTILVSIMSANNEIGTIEPISEIAKIIRHFKKDKNRPSFGFYPVFHTDACQAMNYLEMSNVEKLGVDLMTFNSSKVYGPKGIGLLYKKRSVNLSPLYLGGGQELNLRSGTENVISIAGFSLALKLANQIKQKEVLRLTKLRDYGIKKLLGLTKATGYKIILNGDQENRLPNNINISVLGISSELLIIELDARGIEVSEKSACKSDDQNKSYVIKAIRKVCLKESTDLDGSIRISLGRQTKKSDIDFLVKHLGNILLKYGQWK